MLNKYYELVSTNNELLKATCESALWSFSAAIYVSPDPDTKRQENTKMTMRNLQEMLGRGSKSEFSDLAETSLKRAVEFDFSDLGALFSEGKFVDKVNLLYRLATQLSEEHTSLLRKNIVKLAALLIKYAYYLQYEELNKMLFVFAAVEHQEGFIYFEQLIDEWHRLKHEPAFFFTADETEKLTTFRMRLRGKKLATNKRSFSSKLVKSVCIEKDAQHKIELNVIMPIDQDLGQIAQTLTAYLHLRGEKKRQLQIPLLMFARLATLRTLEAGSIIYQQGEHGDSLALIVHGKLRILVGDGDDQHLVATLTKGDAVGDMSLFSDDAERSATVQAKGQVVLVEITKKSLVDFSNYQTIILQRIFEQLLERADIGRQSLVNAQIYDKPMQNPASLISEVACSGISGHRIRTTIKKMDKIIAFAGENYDSLYLLKDGRLGFFDGDEMVGEFGVGQVYDLLSFFTKDGKYWHTLKVISDECTVVALPAKKAERLTRKDPSLLWLMSERLVATIKNDNEKLRNKNLYQLQRACMTNDVENLLDAIKSGAKVDTPCPVLDALPRFTRPVHVATKHGSTEAVEKLLFHGADINTTDEDGNTAAHIAVMEQQWAIFLLLSKHGADLTICNRNNETPNDLAAIDNFATMSGF